MKCPNCGRENEKDAKFCAVCGASMEKTEEQKEALNNGKKKKNRRRILIVISGVLVVVAVIAAGVWIIRGKQVKKQYDQNLASGQKYLEELNYESAEDSYLKAIQIDPKEPEPYRKLIDTYVAQEKYDDAVKIARKAQNQVPKEEKQEFEKLEQEYDSVIDYEWVVDPTIEADDIYYVRVNDRAQESENERRKEYLSDYAIIQRDDSLGLIGMDGVMRTGMDYTWINASATSTPSNADYIMAKRERIEGMPGSDALYGEELIYNTVEGVPDISEHAQNYFYYQGSLHCLEEEAGYSFQDPEQALPVRNVEEAVDISNLYEWFYSQKGKYGLYKEGKMITDFIYDECGSVSEGIIAVKKDGKWGYIDEEGTEVIPIEYDASWEQFATYDGNVIPFCYAASENYIVLVKDNQWKLVDLNGNTVIPFGVFEAIRPVYQGKCWVKQGGKWGVIKVAEIEKQDLKTNFIGMWKGELAKNSDFIDDGEYSDVCTVELKEDGTIISQCHRSTDTGTYEIIGDNTVKATFDQNYYEAPGIERMLVEGYSYTVLYTYKKEENMLYAEYDGNFNQMGYQTEQKVMFTR